MPRPFSRTDVVVAIRIQNEGQQVSVPEDRMGLREMFPPQQAEDHTLRVHSLNCWKYCPTSEEGAQSRGLFHLPLPCPRLGYIVD